MAESILQPNLLLHEYVLRERLDRGGEAEVWKATTRGADLIRALKLREPVPLTNREQFNRQAAKLESEKNAWVEFTLGSIYIVTLFDAFTTVFEHEGAPYVVSGIASEFSELGDLEKHLTAGLTKTRIKSELSFIDFLLRIISGISAGHRKERLHGDIKPRNILLFEERDVLIPKITDFGISRGLYEAIAGYTPGYSPPEYRSGGSPSVAADVYALGITFLEILYFCFCDECDPNIVPNRYPTGEAFKSKFTASDAASTQRYPWPVDKYLQLFSAMADPDPEQRASLAQVEEFLKVQQRQILGRPISYVPKVIPDSYNWNPQVHEIFEESLHLIFFKGGTPVRDAENLGYDLKNLGIDGYALCLLAVPSG